MSNLSIVIGSYRMAPFVHLNILQCRKVFGDVPILVSDDRSDESPSVQAVAEKLGCAYICPPSRRSHTSGDLQAFINGAAFAEQMGSEVVLKLSQRLIPLDGMDKLILPQFENPETWFVLPGQPERKTFARASAVFFNKFTALTDIVAWRPERMTAGMIIQKYKTQCSGAKQRSDQFIEVFWGTMTAGDYKEHSVYVHELANPQLGKAKAFLRKAQSHEHEYANLAASHGIVGEFSTAEWAHIEKKGYLALAPQL